MKQNEKAQKLREYLRNYTSCQSRKESLTKCLERETDDAVRKILSADKEKMSIYCENVLLIMNYLAPDSLARQIDVYKRQSSYRFPPCIHIITQ